MIQKNIWGFFPRPFRKAGFLREGKMFSKNQGASENWPPGGGPYTQKRGSGGGGGGCAWSQKKDHGIENKSPNPKNAMCTIYLVNVDLLLDVQ